MDAFDALVRQTALDVAVLALPAVALAALVGTIVAVVQAATQVQEQTLTLLPKLVCVLLLCAAGGAAGLNLCSHLFSDAVRAIPQIVRGS